MKKSLSPVATVKVVIRAVAALVCICVFAGDAANAQRRDNVFIEETTVVPDVTNRSIAEALAVIGKAGLSRGTVVNRPSEGKPGLVLDQSPKPGSRVPLKTPIDLAVSQTTLVKVPDVTRLRLPQALAVLDKVGLSRGTVMNRPSPGESGVVLDQSLKPGSQVPPKTPIDLGVSQTILVKVPDVTNRPIAEAWAVLDKVGLSRGTVMNRPSPGEPGLVLNQSPAPGIEVPVLTPLNLVVSTEVTDKTASDSPTPSAPPPPGNPPTAVPPPGSGSNPQPPSRSQTNGTTAPKAPAEEGASNTPGQLVVPDVRGRDIEDAIARLKQAGLIAYSIAPAPTFVPALFQQLGAVLDQLPAAGTVLVAPELVTLVVVSNIRWWTLVLPLLLLASAALLLVRRIAQPSPASVPPHATLPAVKARGFLDRGDQRVQSATNPVLFDIRVRSTLDSGVQSIRVNRRLE